MLFMILCQDKPDSVELRMKTRPRHLEYLKGAGDRVKVSGPTIADGKPTGSVILIDAASKMAVKLFADNDPYTQADLFEKVNIMEWKAGIGTWIPDNQGG